MVAKMKKRLEEVGSLPITKFSWEHIFIVKKCWLPFPIFISFHVIIWNIIHPALVSGFKVVRVWFWPLDMFNPWDCSIELKHFYIHGIGSRIFPKKYESITWIWFAEIELLEAGEGVGWWRPKWKSYYASSSDSEHLSSISPNFE